ncbi:MAG: diguanylate cyclase, partial [Clostridiales bacterium]|nr:diguanylate cyclase [Clostridiales bacterium]
MNKNKKFISIRNKMIHILGIIFIMLILANYSVLYTVMHEKVHLMEEKQVARNLERVENAINNDLSNLLMTTADWAIWDETYRFIQDENEGYIESNLYPEAISNIGIDFIIYLNSRSECVYAVELNEENGRLEALSNDFIDKINKAYMTDKKTPQKASGLILFDSGPALTASCSILQGSGDGEALGRMVLGYYLDEDYISFLSKRLNTILQIGSIKNPEAFKVLGSNLISGATVLEDVNGTPVLELDIQIERDIMPIVMNGLNLTTILLLLCSAAFLGATIIALNKTLLSRVLSLSAAINEIGKQKKFSGRIPTEKNNDEFRIVSENINIMLEELENAELGLIEMNRELESKVEERTASLSAANMELQEEIIQRSKAEEEIRHIAYHDNLTDLPNQRYYFEEMHRAIALAKRTGKILATMFMDLDGFKMINDTMGHLSGDVMLIEVSGRLMRVFRKCDFIARIGGDEFVIMLENLDTIDTINTIARKLLRIFDDPFVINNQECFVTASVGIAIYPMDGENAEEILKSADTAMYNAKENGKNQYVFCTTDLKDRIAETMKLTNHLYRALERNELELYYQPQVSCGEAEIVGVEALLRWNHPELGMVFPNEFIHIAEQTGLIIPIGEWVLRTACRQNKSWHDEGFVNMHVAVNLSVQQFMNTKLVQQVEKILEETGLEPSYLELEITENVAMKETQHIIETLKAFRDLGIRVSI